MRCSHVRNVLSPRNPPMLRQARRNTSCARSSASALPPVKRAREADDRHLMASNQIVKSLTAAPAAAATSSWSTSTSAMSLQPAVRRSSASTLGGTDLFPGIFGGTPRSYSSKESTPL